MAEISTVVVVTVTKTTAAISAAAFGTPIGVFQVDVGTQANRVTIYTSIQEMTDAGFGASSEPVKWATVVIEQRPRPDRFAIGRRIPGVQQVDTVTIATADPGTWTLTIDTIVYSVVGGTLTEQQIAQALSDDINSGTPAITDVLASTPVAGVLTVTARVGGILFVNGGIVVPGGGVGTFVNTVADSPAEVLLTALTAINTENTKDWFIMNIESRADADITTLRTFISTLDKIAVAQSSDADALAGTPANIFDTMQALNPDDLSMYWHDDDREYLDGGVSGILAAAKLDNAGGVITMFGKQVRGVPVDDLTSAEIANIAGDGESNFGFGGNVHVEIASRGFILWGQAASGEFTDVETTILWTKARVAEVVFTVLATTPTKIPGTNAGILKIINATQGKLVEGVTNGHFSGDTPPTTTGPTSAERTTADKNTRVLRNIIGNAELAGAIHKTFIQVNVNV